MIEYPKLETLREWCERKGHAKFTYTGIEIISKSENAWIKNAMDIHYETDPITGKIKIIGMP